MDELEILKEKADLVQSKEYQKIRHYQIEKIINLSISGIDEKELKGMLKMIKTTDMWKSDYDKKNKT